MTTLGIESIDNDLNFSTSDIECLTIVLMPSNHKALYITAVHLPPDGKISEAIFCLIHLINHLELLSKHWVARGTLMLIPPPLILEMQKSLKTSPGEMHWKGLSV